MSASPLLRLRSRRCAAVTVRRRHNHSQYRTTHTLQEFDDWVAGRDAGDLAEPFTFVVAVGGVLRLAPRRSEHVMCAGGGEVLSAGEMAFERVSGRWEVGYVSNQSTGYCPEGESWPAVAAALDQIGLPRPEGFTSEFVFRRCPACRELNVVRDEAFACAMCDGDLPRQWNVGSRTMA